jgi:predicted kinase
MPTLHVTRGLPGSGKTHWAKAWVAEDPAARARVNRDDLRGMIHDGRFVKGVTEPQIVAARDAVILGLLRRGADAVSDDTNLPQRTVRDLARLARQAGAGLEVHDFTDVPLDLCIERDAARDRTVGEQVIRDMHARFLRGLTLPLPLPEDAPDDTVGLQPYEAKPGTPKAVLVDIDGTTALLTGRSPYDETRVHEDLPNEPVIAVVRAMHQTGHRIVFMSGRSEACREATERWLQEHLRIPFEGPFMRQVGDKRKDAALKAELFDRHVRDIYDVACVLDDRASVVRAWRAMGLTVLQVAEGDF